MGKNEKRLYDIYMYREHHSLNTKLFEVVETSAGQKTYFNQNASPNLSPLVYKGRSISLYPNYEGIKLES